MKKDKAWLKDSITREIQKLFNERNPSFFDFDNASGAIRELVDQLDESEITIHDAYDKLKEVSPLTEKSFDYYWNAINDGVELDEPEVLSQEWLDEHSNGASRSQYVWVDDLKELLVPKQEELEVKIQELIESYKQEEDAYSNPENGWISVFIEDLKNLVEEEQKYYVYLGDGQYLVSEDELKEQYAKIRHQEDSGFSNYVLTFTEQEIRDYDERYWAFAVKVEEME